MPCPRSSFRWWRKTLLLANMVGPAVVIGRGFQSMPANAATATAHALLLWGMIHPTSAWLGPVVTRFRTRRREVWLTIDDGPTPGTAALAAMLAQLGVRATFFWQGNRVAGQEALVREVREAGHTIGNHSFTHPVAMFWCAGPRRIAKEVELAQTALEEAGAEPLPAFRAPAGIRSVFLERELRERGLRLVGWSVRGFDGVRCDPAAVVERILARLHPGAIILAHEGKAGLSASGECLARLVHETRARGYEFVLPDEATWC